MVTSKKPKTAAADPDISDSEAESPEELVRRVVRGLHCASGAVQAIRRPTDVASAAERHRAALRSINESAEWWAQAIRDGDAILPALAQRVRAAGITREEPCSIGGGFFAPSAVETLCLVCGTWLQQEPTRLEIEACGAALGDDARDYRHMAFSEVDLDRIEARAAFEAQRVQAQQDSDRAAQADDVDKLVADVECRKIARALWNKPDGMRPGMGTNNAIRTGGLVAACGASAGTWKDRRKRMIAAGLLERAGLALRLTPKGRKAFAAALSKTAT